MSTKILLLLIVGFLAVPKLFQNLSMFVVCDQCFHQGFGLFGPCEISGEIAWLNIFEGWEKLTEGELFCHTRQGRVAILHAFLDQVGFEGSLLLGGDPIDQDMEGFRVNDFFPTFTVFADLDDNLFQFQAPAVEAFVIFPHDGVHLEVEAAS